MARNEVERRQRTSEGHNTSKGARPVPHLSLASLFGAGPAVSPRRRRPSGDQEPYRDRDRGPGRSGSKDHDRDRDQLRDRRHDSGQERKHRRKHETERSERQEGKDSRHRSENRHHHRSRSRERLLIDVELRSLDDRYHNWKCAVPANFPIARLETYIRRQYLSRNKSISPNAHFIFYADGQPLKLEEELGRDRPHIWYRMTKNLGDLDNWKFTHWQDETNGRIDTDLTDRLVKAVDEGATVAKLREIIADFMKIDDVYRIVLTARDGMRPGLLQGNRWEVRQVKKWLCRWISIDVHPVNGYVVLQGLDREYVYHPDVRDFERGMEIKAMQSYLNHRLFRAVRLSGRSEFELTYPNITLTNGGGPLASFTPLRWGATYAFQIPDDVAEIFAEDESWLLAPTETCAICLDEKRITDMPIRITKGCKHKPALCKDCLKQWLQSSMERASWDRLKCPDCPELLKYSDVKRYAAKDTFDRYDTLATRAAVEMLPNFRWCLSPICESGQIDVDECPRFKCQACPAKHCIKHNVPWHKGETCDDYDKRNKQRKKDDKASEQMIRKTSKKCPECKKDVHKFTGCNHITCVCGHEWCYICFAPFQRNEHGFLFCRHTPECSERDPFIDLIDPNHANRPPPAWPPPAAGRPFPRPPPPHPNFFPFAPQHLRRQNVNTGVAGAPTNNRRVPPPVFPFPAPLAARPPINRGDALRARRRMDALRAAVAPNPPDVLPGFENLHL
ncbi:hypothetical protein OQA88_1607 [Cercophora sp. LCS_1]